MISDEMVDAAARSFWETERWHYMESFDQEIDSVQDYFRNRAREALTAAYTVTDGYESVQSSSR